MLDVTFATCGVTPAITKSLLSESEFPPPIAGNVSTAALFAASFIVPPARANAPVPVYSRSALVSPATTVYENVNVFVPVPAE